MQQRNGKQLMMIGGVVFVLLVGIGFLLTSRGGSSKAATVPTTAPVLFASQTIPNGTVFKQGQPLDGFFTVKDVPVNLKPAGAYSSQSQIQQLLVTPGCGPVKAAGCEGHISSAQTIFQNEPIVQGMFNVLGQYREAVGPSFTIPFGYVAIAVNLPAGDDVLGSVEPGDTVDIIGSFHGGKVNGRFINPQTQYALNNVKVISVNAPPTVQGTGPNGAASTSNSTTASTSAQAGSSLVVLARYQEALVIQHMKDFDWTISVVLRSAKQTAIKHFRTDPVTDGYYFNHIPNPFKPISNG